jgi:hypothetical protein
MTKERATFLWKVVSGPKAFFSTLGGPQAHDSSGRDDNSVAAKILYFSWKRGVGSSNRIVISTGADPDFPAMQDWTGQRVRLSLRKGA